MIEMLEPHRDEIQRACAQHRVARLEVFGSATRAGYRSGESDLNFLVDFQPMAPTKLVDASYGLLDDLQAIFDTSIDLVMRDAVENRFVAIGTDRDRRRIYP